MIKRLPMQLRFFPVMFFTVSMGFGGLTNAWLQAAKTLNTPQVIGDILQIISIVLFVVISAIYIAKAFRYPSEIKMEFSDPFRINFFSAITVSVMLIYMLPFAQCELMTYIWLVTVAVHLVLTVAVVRYWFDHTITTAHSSPAWFMSVVGSLNVVLSSSDAALPHTIFFFAIGLFFWLMLFPVLFYRLIFHPQMPEKFLPTLFIFIVPPSLACMDSLRLFGDIAITWIFYSIALFFVLLILSMIKEFIKLQFFISWWAYTFPLAAFTIATMRLYNISTDNIWLYGCAWALLITVTMVVFYVSLQTFKTVASKTFSIFELERE